MFFRDPSGNALEFKAFADDTMLFATLARGRFATGGLAVTRQITVPHIVRDKQSTAFESAMTPTGRPLCA